MATDINRRKKQGLMYNSAPIYTDICKATAALTTNSGGEIETSGEPAVNL